MKKKTKKSKSRKYTLRKKKLKNNFYAKISLYLMGFVIFIIVLDGLVQAFQKARGHSNPQTSEITSMHNTNGEDSGAANDQISSIEITNYVAGLTVTVEYVNLKDPGFVVVYEENDGELGNTLGISKYLGKGINSTLKVSLSRSTEINDHLFVSIIVDDGDGVFEADRDKILVNDKNEYVGVRFVVGGYGAENPRM